jgi:hypothetical protein
MDGLVPVDVLNTLYTSVKERLYPKPPSLHILVTHYKTPQYLNMCLTTIFCQVTSIPFHVYVVDDHSDMHEVSELLNVWKEREPIRLHVTIQPERLNKARNLFHILENNTFHQEDIIGVVDGDDWLASPDSFERVVQEYIHTGCWVTYGSYICSDGKTENCTTPMTAQHIYSEALGRGFRDAPWIFSHLFTAKAFLWKQVKRDIIEFDGIVKDEAPADQVFNMAIAEMASSKHISNISDILYVYNNQSSLNDCVVRPDVQSEYDNRNRAKNPYLPIERPLLDFVLFIPCRGRRPLLETTLKRFNEENLDINAPIFLIEHSERPEYKELAIEKGLGWIYIPLIGNSDSPQGQFNRALCFDIGFLYGYPANYVICHDNDLLVPVDFWKKLKENMEYENSKVLQTYSDRFVWQTSPPVSERLIQDLSWFKNGFSVEEHCTQNNPGAKGGSLVLSREAYLRVGGHDPHFFFGYGPEDAFLWRKLQLHYVMGYGDHPRIPLTHLWHPNAAKLNPLKQNMDFLFYRLNELSPGDLLEYATYKSEHFSKTYKMIHRG